MQPKHKRFADEYLVDLNGTQAAIRAGYAKGRARQTACDLLGREDVAAYLSERQSEVSEQSGITIKEVVDRLAGILRANMYDYAALAGGDLSKLTREQAAAVRELVVDHMGATGEAGEPPRVTRVRFSLHDPQSAADKLLRHLGGYAPVKVTTPEGQPFEVKDVTPLDAARRIAFVLEQAARSEKA